MELVVSSPTSLDPNNEHHSESLQLRYIIQWILQRFPLKYIFPSMPWSSKELSSVTLPYQILYTVLFLLNITHEPYLLNISRVTDMSWKPPTCDLKKWKHDLTKDMTPTSGPSDKTFYPLPSLSTPYPAPSLCNLLGDSLLDQNLSPYCLWLAHSLSLPFL
jgi:hypothetical protein